MTIFQMCDNCGKARLDPTSDNCIILTEDTPIDKWFVFQSADPRRIVQDGMLKDRPFVLDFCSPECSKEGIDGFYAQTTNIYNLLKKKGIEYTK